jgi:hypothetical protein
VLRWNGYGSTPKGARNGARRKTQKEAVVGDPVHGKGAALACSAVVACEADPGPRRGDGRAFLWVLSPPLEELPVCRQRGLDQVIEHVIGPVADEPRVEARARHDWVP